MFFHFFSFVFFYFDFLIVKDKKMTENDDNIDDDDHDTNTEDNVGNGEFSRVGKIFFPPVGKNQIPTSGIENSSHW